MIKQAYIIFARCLFSVLLFGKEKLDRGYGLFLRAKFRTCGNHLYIKFPASLYGENYIALGNNFIAGERLRLEAISEFLGDHFEPQIEIGENFHCLNNVHIGAIGYMQIGKNVLIGSNVTIVDHNHGYYDRAHQSKHESPTTPPLQRQLSREGNILIGNNVWIAEGAIVLPGAHIGDGAIIGANAVVRGIVPSAAIVASGVAVIIKEYDEYAGIWKKVALPKNSIPNSAENIE